MKVAKLVIGIVSFILSIVVGFMSCAAGVVSGLSGNAKDTSGGSGLIIVLFMIVAGIVAIAAKNSKGGAIATAIIYAIAGIIGVSASGLYKDLIVWGVVNFIFAAFFVISIFAQKYPPKKAVAEAAAAKIEDK